MKRKEGIPGLNAEVDINLQTKQIDFYYKEKSTARHGYFIHLYLQLLLIPIMVISIIISAYIWGDYLIISENWPITHQLYLYTLITITWTYLTFTTYYILGWTSIILHENIKWFRDTYPIANGHLRQFFGSWYQINLKRKVGLTKNKRNKITKGSIWYYIYKNKLITNFPITRFEYKYKSKTNKITRIRTYN